MIAGSIQPLAYVFIIFLIFVLIFFIIFLIFVLTGQRIRQHDKDEFYRKNKDKK